MRSIFLLVLMFFYLKNFSQERSVGLLSYIPEESYEGYNFFYPHGQNNAYVLDNCGEIVHSWIGDVNYVPGNSAYVDNAGSLIKCSRHFDRFKYPIFAGGAGGKVEKFDWDGNLIWSFEKNDSLSRLHHDIEVLENGNVLMISWEVKNFEESLAAGRNPERISQDNLWPDFILEYNPEIDSIVWEWHSWDHLVQDYDSTKVNFGIIQDNPQRININYETNSGLPDWLHTNSIDYNEELDQILLSVPNFDEIWIIDHSTTTEEAKTSKGGNSDKGGDLLYRWGNPKAYDSDGDQLLFFQHDAHWISDFIPDEDTIKNEILIFNNRFNDDYSAVNIITPEFLEDGYNYEHGLPSDYYKTITHPIKEKLFSTGLSSAQYLPNGNFLIISGRQGYAFEITSQNEIVWEYRIPLSNGQAVEQGAELSLNDNLTFRFNRYPIDYSAFKDRELVSQGVLEIDNNSTDICNRVVSNIEIETSSKIVYPNPSSDFIRIDAAESFIIYNIYGEYVMSSNKHFRNKQYEISGLEKGVYFIVFSDNQVSKFMKI